LPRTGGVWLNPRGYAISVRAAIGSHRLCDGRFGTESVLEITSGRRPALPDDAVNEGQ
jgi:hypothetical protein